ncbi:MAG TPA: hypothetical protein VJP79_00290, partial [Nitrososphaera sp.]|nr:hypothetical protein [Nitrososphaera sp.]
LGALKSGNIEKMGALMNANHELLRQIGVSHRKTEELLDICLGAGAKGAKMTGAGGGGAVIALAESVKDSKKIASFVRDAGYESMEVEIDCDGLLLQMQSNSSGQ